MREEVERSREENIKKRERRKREEVNINIDNKLSTVLMLKLNKLRYLK